MSLRRGIEFIKSHEKELVLFNVRTAAAISDEIATHVETRNVRVRTAETASGAPTELAVLSSDEAVIAVVGVSELRAILVDETGDPTSSEGGDAEASRVLSHLKETTFTSYDTEQLLYTSREIEDRARRVGDGTIHTGFQYISRMADQREIYRDLAQCGITVHAYGVPDAPALDIGSAHIHARETDEIARTWFVIFDGNGDDTQKTALLAEEYEPDTYYGAWTYDPQLVETFLTYLDQTYLSSGERTRSSLSE